MSTILLGVAIGFPLSLLLACASPSLRRRMPGLFGIAPLPALTASLFAKHGTTVALAGSGFALQFSLDMSGAMLLGAAAVLWILSGFYAAHAPNEVAHRDGFVISWLMTLTGSIGVFLAADLIGFYFLLAVLSVGASGLVLQGRGPQALRASAIYLGVALLAEAFLLAGLILLAQASGSLLIRDAAAAVTHSPWRDATLVLLLVGFGIKAGMVPMHFWMPIAYGTAPIPAASVMSGAVVKASILAMIRFLPLGTALPDFGHPLVLLGLIGAFYGVAIGITQSQPKVILAYSSVSQMGFLVALVGMGLALGDSGTTLAVAFYAMHHLLVKGALFLAVGAAILTGRRHLRPILIPAAIIAVGLGGLPLTGGALAKYVAKDLMGQGFANSAAVLSSVATTLLMIHFLRQLRATTAADPDARAPPAVAIAWLAMASVALMLPWVLYLSIPLDTFAKAVAPAALWSALWPVLVGVAAAFVGKGFAGRLPQVQAGDVGVVLYPLTRAGMETGKLVQRFDAFVRRWSVSCATLLLISLLLGWALMR